MSEFCPDCDVTMDLHDGPDSCDYAESRACAIESVERMFFGGIR